MKSILTGLLFCLALRPAAAEAPAKPDRIEFLAGTWCFADGIRAHYAVVPPSRLRVTRLDPARIAQAGPVSEFAIVEFGRGRFVLRPLSGNRAARFHGRIDGEAAFTYIEWTVYDEAERRTVTHVMNQSAKRCGAEVSALGARAVGA